MDITLAAISLGVAGAFFFVGWFVRGKIGLGKIARAGAHANKLVEAARAEAESLKKEKLLEAEEKIFRMREEVELEQKQAQEKFRRAEKSLAERESTLDGKVDILTTREREIAKAEHALQTRSKQVRQREEELDHLVDEQNAQLERISGISSEEAKKIQMQNILDQAHEEAAATIREIREDAGRTARQQAREIVVQAIQRSGLSHVVETTVSVVSLPSDDMKGRIIGREGRNIRTFETATGIEVLIDDTPDVVMLSGFDPVRREIARLSLEKLIYDGRIHPGRIEEVIEKTRQEIEEQIFEYGEQALLDASLHGVHHEIVKLLGTLKLHTSKGQNVLQHSLEVAVLAGLMASELELEAATARRAGLLHEIGHSLDNTAVGTISELSADLAKKYGENEEIQNAILCAHATDTTDQAMSAISVLVAAADEISRSRPGAEKQMLEDYFTRLKDLEELANSVMGVTNSFAIQAGRELRVIAEYSDGEETRVDQIANSISRKIKGSLAFPGQIKISVIREYRSVEFAR